MCVIHRYGAFLIVSLLFSLHALCAQSPITQNVAMPPMGTKGCVISHVRDVPAREVQIVSAVVRAAQPGVVKALAEHAELRYLDLAFDPVWTGDKGALLDELALLPFLTALRVHGSSLLPRHWTILGSMEGLEELAVRYPESLTKRELLALRKCRRLTALLLQQPTVRPPEEVDTVGLCEEMGQWLQLQTLHLIECTLSASCFVHMAKLSSLVELDLGGSVVSDEALEVLSRFSPNLEVLSLRGSRTLTNRAVAHLRRVPKLRALDIGNCEHIDGASAGYLRELVTLSALNVEPFHELPFPAGTPDVPRMTYFTHLSDLPALEALWLDNNRWLSSDSFARQIALFPKLRRLSVRGCSRIDDEGLVAITKLTSLTSLDVSGTAIAGHSPAQILQLEQLEEFRCDEVPGLRYEFVLAVTKLSKLRVLSLSRTGANDERIGLACGNCKMLQRLEVSGCQWVTLSVLGLIADSPSVLELNVAWCSSVDDDAAKRLLAAKSLTKLFVTRCPITDAVISELRTTLSGCAIFAQEQP